MPRGRIPRMSATFQKSFDLSRLYIENGNVCIIEGFRIDCTHGEQDSLAAGQDAGIPVLPLAGREVDFDNFLRLPTGRRDALESTWNLGDKINHVIRRPCCAYVASGADIYRRTTVQGYLPEDWFPRRRPHKSNPSSIKRAKWSGGIEGEELRFQLTERPQIEDRDAYGDVIGDTAPGEVKRYLGAFGRNSHSLVEASQRECPLGQGDTESRQAAWRRPPPQSCPEPPPNGSSRGGARQCAHRRPARHRLPGSKF